VNLEPAVEAHLRGEEPMPPNADIPTFRDELRRRVDKNFTAYGLAGPDVAEIVDHEVPVTDGSIVVRSYRPHHVTGAAPAHAMAHGGGWVTGSIDELVCDATARHRAVSVGCVVFAIEYRLAPEYPFPTAVHDVIASMRWIRAESDRLGVDAANVSLGGNSAGANLAAAAALAAPDLELRHLLLEVPALDLTTATLRAELAAGEYFETVDMIEQALALYFAEPAAAADPLASPLLAPDLGAMPPTTVAVAEHDPLRREGQRFAERLREAGVPVDYTCYPGAMHGSPILNRVWPTARRWHDDSIAVLRNVHGVLVPHGSDSATPHDSH
jgi:acetyl esterase